MEFKAYPETNRGMELMKKFYAAVLGMERDIAQTEAEANEIRGMYERSVDDRVELYMQIKERGQLIRDMLAFEDHHCADCLCNDSDGKREMKSCFAARRFAERAEQMGIGV